jgi:hypothetical protein
MLLLALPSFGGQLSGFENAVSKPSPFKSSSIGDDDDDFWGSLFFGCLFGGRSKEASTVPMPIQEPSAGSDVSTSAFIADDSGSQADFVEDELTGDEWAEDGGLRHRKGTTGLPYVRFDYRWQYLDSQLDAHDYLLEAGYKILAFYGRSTDYEDRSNGETLNIDQYYGMLRYGGGDDFFFPGTFQIAAGLGGYSIRGMQKQDGVAFTLPLSFNPYDFIGFEFRPAWASINDRNISDYDISMSLGYLYLQGRIGYRWLWVQHDGHWLDGPYAGMTFTF